MAAGTPQDVADRWATRMAASSEKIKAGVMAVTTAPQQKAAAAADTWLARLNDPRTKAKFISSLQRSTLQDWQNGMLQKGLQRIATGTQAAKPKFMDFLSAFLPFVNSVAAQVRQMPKMSLEDSIARSAAQIRGNAAFKR